MFGAVKRWVGGERPGNVATVDERKGQKAASVITRPDMNVLELIDVRRAQIRKREYKPIGRLEKIMLGENCVPKPEPDNPLLSWTRLSQEKGGIAISLDWLGKGPVIGVTQDGMDILVCTKTIHPPPLPDPTWKQPENAAVTFVHEQSGREATPYEIELWSRGQLRGLMPKIATAPLVEQRLRDRRYGFLDGRNGDRWHVFMPVTQILFWPLERNGMGTITYMDKEGMLRVDGSGRACTLLYNPSVGEAHILFGTGILDIHTPANTPMSKSMAMA